MVARIKEVLLITLQAESELFPGSKVTIGFVREALVAHLASHGVEVSEFVGIELLQSLHELAHASSSSRS